MQRKAFFSCILYCPAELKFGCMIISMNPTSIGIVVFGCAFGGAFLGMKLRTILPDNHLNDTSRDAIKLSIGLVATMTALVLGLVTASAKSSFDTVDRTVKDSATNVLTLDRMLARYGPETAEIRRNLRDIIVNRTKILWEQRSDDSIRVDPMIDSTNVEGLADSIGRLTPRDERQRSLQFRAQNIVETQLEARWLIIAQGGTSIPGLFIIMILFWITTTFATFGLLVQKNRTVCVVFFFCALSVGSAVFLIMEMDSPFDGVLKVSGEPVMLAIERLNQ